MRAKQKQGRAVRTAWKDEHSICSSTLHRHTVQQKWAPSSMSSFQAVSVL